MRVPALDWARAYNRGALAADLTAAVIVTVMLVPQSLAYAMLAGLPAEVGLYASIMPLILYAFLGTSKTLSVGPVAVVSLMTAVALGNVAQQGTADYLTAAIVLALLSGALLTAMGLLKLGFLANFLSLPVVSGFISASGILIAVSQLKHVLGVSAYGETVTTMAASLFASVPQTSFPTLVLGCLSIMVLLWARSGAVQFVTGFGVSRHNATMISRGAPIVVIAATIVAAFQLQLSSHGVALVGEIPRGLPSFSLPIASWALIENLALPAVMISIIGYVESISVGRTLAGKKQQKIDADQELIG